MCTPAYAELLPDMLRVLGPDHSETLTVRGALAWSRGKTGEAAEAVAAFAQLLVDPGWSGELARSLRTTELAADLGMATFPHGDRLPAALALAGRCCRDKVPAVGWWYLTLEPLHQEILSAPLQAGNGTLPVRTTPGLAEPLNLPAGTTAMEVTGL